MAWGDEDLDPPGGAVTSVQPGAAPDPLPDLPLIREDLLIEIEQRRLAGAPINELLELRRQYEELPGLRRR